MHKQINQLRADLMAQFPERKDVIDGSLAAVLASEHVLLIGPPGTAKSALVRCLAQVFGGSYFERLLTKFSTPEELFGPLSLKALEDDRYERLTEGYLPTAGVAFLDEVFKANSAILNALLTLLNEREFDNGAGRTHTPLISVVAASNEVPVDESLHAFYDRFLLRVPVQPARQLALGRAGRADQQHVLAGQRGQQAQPHRGAAFQQVGLEVGDERGQACGERRGHAPMVAARGPAALPGVIRARPRRAPPAARGRRRRERRS